MSIRFNCPQCDKKLKAPDDYAGLQVKCSGCREVVQVPGEIPYDLLPGAAEEEEQQQEAAPQPESNPTVDDDAIFPRRKMSDDDGLDMTPMVDVTFLLLIFFMVTAAFALQKSIELPTPDSQEGAKQKQIIEDIKEDDYVNVRIDKDSTVFVNDIEAPSSHDVLAKLKEARRGTAGSDSPGPSKLQVFANGDARHEVVVMVLDMGTAAGMDGVRLTTVEEDF